MLKPLLILAGITISFITQAAVVKWSLTDFKFNDSGTAYGTFVFDTKTNQLSDIDIYTTAGNTLNGRHYVAPAGDWGLFPQYGILAFTDSIASDLTGAGWFRMDFDIDFDATIGTSVYPWLAVGAESFCVNSNCNSAANEITNPGKSRDTVSGHLVAISNVPLPPAMWLFGTSPLVFFTGHRGRRHLTDALVNAV